MAHNKLIIKSAAAVLALILALPSAASDSLLTQMKSAKTKAESYERSENYTFAHRYLSEYANLAATLADEGAISRKVADIAAAHRDFLEFSPTICAGQESRQGVFFGGDGYFAEGASAVRICVPYGDANVEDYYHLISKTTEELCVLVTLEVSREKTMRNIAFGKDDVRLIENLRQLSLIEGRVYLAFCPSVNTLNRTRTLPQSYISAYRYVADAARRYAPNAELVYSLGDVLTPGEDTVTLFYPGDEYVDVFGVELCHTYNTSDMPSSEAAFDRRGEYYDPAYSVKYMADKFAAVSGNDDTPVAVTGCSFPWAGWAAVPEWAEEMRRFYSTVPVLCPNLTAVFYTNVSSAYGICNLRQNEEAAEIYEECLALPWYSGCDRTALEDGAELKAGSAMRLGLYCGAKFDDAEYEVWLDGKQISADSAMLGYGEQELTVYITDERCSAKLEYRLIPTDGGMLKVQSVPASVDYNGNGIMDFGDVDLLKAYISGWNVDLGEAEGDINGDGITNSRDMTALMGMICP